MNMHTTKRFGVLALAGLLAAGAYAANNRVACRVELDRAVLPAGGSQRAVIKVSLSAPANRVAQERQPVNLAVALDRSGSMSSDGKLEKAKEAAVAALRRLGPRDLFSLVVYDHEAETLVPPQSAANAEWIEARINGIVTRGNTALFAGVSLAAAEIRKNLEGNYVHRILLLSDGQANCGPSSPDDLGRLGAAFMKERIAVTTIGLGNDYNEDLMTRLAQNSDGNTYFVAASQDLPRIFQSELGDVLSVCAGDVVLDVELLGGAHPVRIIGRDGKIDSHSVQLRLNNLYGGQEKFVLVEVEVPACGERDTLRLASARCAYRNLYSRENEVSTGETTVRFSGQAQAVKASANLAVQKDLLLNELAEAKDQAIRKADEGKREEAATVLLQAAEKARSRAADYAIKDDAVVGGAAAAKEYGQQVGQKGLDRISRKALRTDSYQTRNQQAQPEQSR